MFIHENNMAFWLPRLQRTSEVKVPKTLILKASEIAQAGLVNMSYASKSSEITDVQLSAVSNFFDLVELNTRLSKYPLNIRTGHTAFPLHWSKTGYVTKSDLLFNNILELSALSHEAGLPIDTWVFRQILQTDPIGVTSFRLPVAKQKRVIFRTKNRNLEIELQDYWTKERATDKSKLGNGWLDILDEANTITKKDEKIIIGLTKRIARYFDDQWSLDWIQHSNGDWYAIDMERIN